MQDTIGSSIDIISGIFLRRSVIFIFEALAVVTAAAVAIVAVAKTPVRIRPMVRLAYDRIWKNSCSGLNTPGKK